MLNLQIKNKPVFICESHHHVLYFWEQFKASKPFVFSLDHHTDVRMPFHKFLFDNKTGNRSELLTQISNGDMSLVENLKHDEHIQTAIDCRFVEKVIVFSHESNTIICDRIFSIKESRAHYNDESIIINDSICNFNCMNRPHDETCTSLKYDTVIDSDHLNGLLNEVKETISNDNWLENFILDIDLDYFHNHEAFERPNLDTFKMLIAKSKGISIAMEPNFLKTWSQDLNYEIDPKFLIDKIIKLI